jgi:hypothetical protein
MLAAKGPEKFEKIQQINSLVYIELARLPIYLDGAV